MCNRQRKLARMYMRQRDIDRKCRRKEQERIAYVNRESGGIFRAMLKIAFLFMAAAIGIAVWMWAAGRQAEMEAQAAVIVKKNGLSATWQTGAPVVEQIPESFPEEIPPVGINEAAVATMPDALIVEPVGEQWESLGVFRCTAYCGCRTCNGKWYGQPSASGAPLQAGVTVAVDKHLIPFFSTLKIDGIGVRVAHDTGRNIKGNSIDVYIPNHAIASAFGIQYHEVWILRR